MSLAPPVDRAAVRFVELAETPLEEYDWGGRLWVKREDLCWPTPAISKARGVWGALLGQARSFSHVAVVDTGRSVNGWLVATIGASLGRKVWVGYPFYKHQRADELPASAMGARSAGATVFPVPANRQFVMRARAQVMLRKALKQPFFMFPTGLRLQETVEAVAIQAWQVRVELGCRIGTVVVPTGTGTHAAGILRGLYEDEGTEVVCVAGYHRAEKNLRRYIRNSAAVPYEESRLRIVDPHRGYFEVRATELPPWPAQLHYEVPAAAWVKVCLESLKRPVVFWNIGA